MWEGAVHANKVFPSSPPSMQAKAGWEVLMRCVTPRPPLVAPSVTRMTSGARRLATQIPPASSKQMPSGAAPRGTSAHTRRLERSPLGAMSKAVSRVARVSATTSVLPSGVTTVPLGNMRSVAATRARPSGSTQMRFAGCSSHACVWPSSRCRRTYSANLDFSRRLSAKRSNPKLPTYARPVPSTAMSLQWKVASDDRSACSSREGEGDSLSLRSFLSVIETTSMVPSASHPVPEGWFGTATTSSLAKGAGAPSSPLARGVIFQTLRSYWSDTKRLPRRHLGPSGKISPSTPVLASSASAAAMIANQRGVSTRSARPNFPGAGQYVAGSSVGKMAITSFRVP
mmetsp:Transcript_1821/g.4156  ORF Transcript_1821/g.4156 Transcript_1821/m.4156 type:complete len:342 (-) Transcript_1821:27-1052(-)